MGWYPMALALVLLITPSAGHRQWGRPLGAGFPPAQGATAGQQPLAKDEVMDLVEAGMDSSALAKKVEKLGINFEPTDDYLDALRKAGAQDVLIQALRNANPKPLSKEQVLKLVAGGVPSARAAALVKQHGIDFVADDRFMHTLGIAGADDLLISAVRAASLLMTGELLVETSPGASVYLDGQMQGQADDKGVLDLRATLGSHAIKVSAPGKRDFEQNVTLSAGSTSRLEASLGEEAPAAGAVRVSSRDGLAYVYIPPGGFAMGCSSGDSECLDDEKPQHYVTLTRAFWLGKTEVTVAAYKRFVAATAHAMPPDPKFNARELNPGWSDPNMPIVGVSWADAQDYCTWAGGGLPTEAEWEYAARAGTTTARYGDLDDIAWYADDSGRTHIDSAALWKQDQKTYYTKLDDNGDGIHDVAQKTPNPWGLFDMLGNLSEWTQDWYDAHYYQNSTSQDPTGPATGTQRILRGWNWFVSPFTMRVSRRGPTDPTTHGNACGVRCALPTVP